MSDKPCTCHPDDNPPVPCPQKFALSECRAAVPLPHAVAIQMCSDFKESDQSCGDPNHSPESCTCLKLARAWRGMESDLAAAQDAIDRKVAEYSLAMANLGQQLKEAQEARQAAEERAEASERALAEIREEWAGAECGEPVTAQEAYAIQLCKRMYQIAVAAIAG